LALNLGSVPGSENENTNTKQRVKTMKKFILAACAGALFCATQAQALNSIYWGTGGASTDKELVYLDGSLASVGWQVQLIFINNDSVGQPQNAGSMGDDTVFATATIGTGVGATKNQAGNLYVTATTYTYNSTTAGNPSQTIDNSDQFIIRVFNNANTANATWYLDVYKTGTTTAFSLAASKDGQTDSFYTVGSVGGTPQDTLPGAWQPIPEPMTMALALVGVGAIALRRRFMKK